MSACCAVAERQLALTAILAGAVGNVIDRVRFDYVVDFLDVYWGTYHWPAFNIADAAICIGAGCIILESFKQSKHEKNT